MVPVPPMLGISECTLLKTEKKKLMNYSTEDQDTPNPKPPEITMVVENGNALIHS